MGNDVIRVAGSIGILWNPKEVSLENYLAYEFSLSAKFHIIGTRVRGVLTNVYGTYIAGRKNDFFKSLGTTHTWVGYWHRVIGGDFKLICNLEEKKEGHRALSNFSEIFNEKIVVWELVDLQPDNHFFTWTNKRSGERHIASRLDRFLVSESILTGGGDITAIILPSAGSDHWPVSLNWLRVGEHLRRSFRFEQFWLTNEDLSLKFHQWWDEFLLKVLS